jgi:hypothetical protein
VINAVDGLALSDAHMALSNFALPSVAIGILRSEKPKLQPLANGGCFILGDAKGLSIIQVNPEGYVRSRGKCARQARS